MITTILQDANTQEELSDPHMHWDWTKAKIRKVSMDFKRSLNTKRNKQESDLQSKLSELTVEADSGMRNVWIGWRAYEESSEKYS